MKTNPNLCDKCRFHSTTCEGLGVQLLDSNVIECESYKPNQESIYFRASSIGIIAGGLVRNGLTERQTERVKELELITLTPIGLTDKQKSDLDKWNDNLKNGKTLTTSQLEKREDYTNRLTTFKQLTEKQTEELNLLKEKESRPPTLSKGAKTHIKKVWLENERGFYEEITDKKLRKGKLGEEDGINLISFVDRYQYVKNEKRVYNNNNTGECDVITDFEDLKTESGTVDAVVIDDIKCSWNPRTFMSATLTAEYEWQGRDYLHLYDADIFRLRHCLVNCPPDVFNDEYSRFCFANKIGDDSLTEYQDQIKQFIRNYIYDKESYFSNNMWMDYPDIVTNYLRDMNLQYSIHERVKTFMFERDYEKEKIMLDAIKLAVDYYHTISLNMIDYE